MSRDPHLPVLVGVGEAVRRPGDDGPTEPAALAVEAIRAALADAGAGEALLGRVGAIGAVPPAAWTDGDPGRRVAELIGRADLPTLRSSMQGGNGPQLLVNVLAERIQAGRLDAAIVCGAEALSTVARLAKQGQAPDWPAADPAREPGRGAGAGPAGQHRGRERRRDDRADHGLPADRERDRPRRRPHAGAAAGAGGGAVGALQRDRGETAGGVGETAGAHRRRSWRPRSPDNRRVTHPYTKLLNANIQVDQGAALILCSAGVAAALGVPRERWVFVHAGARATDEWFVSERRELHRSPAIRACGEALFARAGMRAEELGPIDLYSCFPAAVQLAARELGLPLEDPARPLTCTGGLTFFGGPGNNYATHGIAAVARQLRAAAAGHARAGDRARLVRDQARARPLRQPAAAARRSRRSSRRRRRPRRGA